LQPQRVRRGKPLQHRRHPPGLHGLSLVRPRERRATGVGASGSLVARPRGAPGLPEASDAAVDLSRHRHATADPCRARRVRRTTPRMHIEPFRIAVPDAVLADLRERLARTRFPDEIPASGWTYGTNLAYAFDVVAPSMPGYGFSDHPTEPGMDTERIAALWAELMAGLGYQRFGAQGGDWGAMVTTYLGARHPARVLGIHLNMVIALPE